MRRRWKLWEAVHSSYEGRMCVRLGLDFEREIMAAIEFI